VASLVYIVDDDASYRVAIGRLLRASGYDVMEYASASQLLASPPDGSTASCIVLDVRMPGLSGPDLQERLAEVGSAVPIVFLTGHGNIPTTVRAMRAGAEDFLTKPVSAPTLLAAIQRAVARHQSRLEQQSRLEAERARLDQLTPREREVFGLVIRGRMNKQIAYELGMSERTVKAHRQHVMEKLQARSLAELVSMAERLGVLTEPAHVETPPDAQNQTRR
jgi:FixJ family two-component response regulator